MDARPDTMCSNVFRVQREDRRRGELVKLKNVHYYVKSLEKYAIWSDLKKNLD